MDDLYGVFLFPDNVFLDVINKDKDSLKGVKLSSTIPHITLRESFYSSNVDDFVSEFKQVLKGFSSIDININEVGLFDDEILVYKVERNDKLQNIHELAVLTSQKYVSVPKETKEYFGLTKRQTELLNKYQLPFYFEFYTPHLTLGKIVNESFKKDAFMDFKKRFKPYAFKTNEICVFNKTKGLPHDYICLG